MFCPKCGREAQHDAMFCATCGTELRQAAAQPPTEQAEVAIADPVAPPTVATPPQEAARRTGPSDRALWALVALGIVVAGAGIVLALGGGSPEASSEQIDAPELSGAVPSSELSGAVPPDDEAVAPLPTASSGSAAAAVGSEDGTSLTCTNEVFGYQLSYPSDWFTDAATPRQECRFFSMEPFEIGRGEAPTTDIAVFDVDEPFDAWVDAYDDPEQVTLKDQTELTIGGQRAVLLDLTFKDVVTDAHVYTVDAMGQTLQLYAVLEHTTDFEESKRVLDAMVQSMVFQ